MKRVHRNLGREEVEGLRTRLAELVPIESASIPELLKMMRLVARKSQAEYARMCGVAPRVLTNIESEVGSPTVETLGKLLRPFGFRVGVVMDPERSRDVVGETTESRGARDQPTGRDVRTPSARSASSVVSEPSRYSRSKSSDSMPTRESALARALRKSRQERG
jgi:transcriptional regulator with XRE-family HTH domain